MKTLSIILLSIIPFLSSNAKGWDNVLYKQIESSIVAPTFADKSYRVTKYGASPKASAKINQQAINKAIAVCSKAGGGKVIIPEGTYLTGAIRMQSNVNLVIEQGATLLFAYEQALYPLVKTRWEGLDIMNYSPCIYAYQAENVAISPSTAMAAWRHGGLGAEQQNSDMWKVRQQRVRRCLSSQVATPTGTPF